MELGQGDVLGDVVLLTATAIWFVAGIMGVAIWRRFVERVMAKDRIDESERRWLWTRMTVPGVLSGIGCALLALSDTLRPSDSVWGLATRGLICFSLGALIWPMLIISMTNTLKHRLRDRDEPWGRYKWK
jgi:hypothetical protein